MREIGDCFVGQRQSDISNIRHFIKTHPLTVIGFNAVAYLIVQHLEIALDVKPYIEYERYDYYWYLKVDKDCPIHIGVIRKIIYEYIKSNRWDYFIEINRTIDDTILVLKTEIN